LFSFVTTESTPTEIQSEDEIMVFPNIPIVSNGSWMSVSSIFGRPHTHTASSVISAFGKSYSASSVSSTNYLNDLSGQTAWGLTHGNKGSAMYS